MSLFVNQAVAKVVDTCTNEKYEQGSWSSVPLKYFLQNVTSVSLCNVQYKPGSKQSCLQGLSSKVQSSNPAPIPNLPAPAAPTAHPILFFSSTDRLFTCNAHISLWWDSVKQTLVQPFLHDIGKLLSNHS